MTNKLENYLRVRSLSTKFLFILICIFCLAVSVSAQEKIDRFDKSLLILHTNDIHDHLRPDYDGVGGIPYVSGFVREIRSQRNDVLVLDAGDIAEKGDLVARKTGSELTFEALSRVGYHAWTPGNHDHDFGIEALHKFEEISGIDLLCINLLKEDGSPEFNPSNIFNINGVKVGVIGAIRPRNALSLDWDDTALAMSQEAERLKEETDLIVALVHISVRQSEFISKIATEIDVFISGHSHEALHEIKKVSETGAIIVQAGSYGDYVGWLELSIDSEGRHMAKEYDLISMDHKRIQPDLEMIEWIRNKELEIAPEANQIISWTSREIGMVEIGYLAAEALRKVTGADVAFNHSADIVRSTLLPGLLDLNAIYRTGGERGKEIVEFELTGYEIQNYLKGMKKSQWYQTQWSGFYSNAGDKTYHVDFDLEKKYRVVMPHQEYDRRFRRLFERIEENPDDWPGITGLTQSIEPKFLDITWTDAMVQLLSSFNQKSVRLEDEIHRIIEETGQVIHMEYESKYD